MKRVVKVGLIQAKWEGKVEKMIQKNERMIDEATGKGAQIICLQELFFGPYFPAEQNPKWYEFAEPIPGPLTSRMKKKAKEHSIVLIVPMYEKEMPGVYYNTSVILDANGEMLGKYRKNHIPQLKSFWEKFYFKPGNLGYPVFDTKYAKVGVYICYDRHFPEGARVLGLNGAEIVFNPSATIADLSAYLWELEQPAHAVANGYFVAAVNRVGVEKPWNIGKFYGSSYICNPRGKLIAKGSRDKDEIVVGEVDLDMIREVRNLWQFYRDRRPETYNKLVDL
jgi:N-carbamoylputrescine amidase